MTWITDQTAIGTRKSAGGIMDRPARAELIRNIGVAFDGLKSNRQVDIVLKVFGLQVPERDDWGNGGHATDSLIEADEQTLLEIARHLTVKVPDGAARTIDTGLWGSGSFRVFISHLTAKKVVAKKLADEMSLYGIKAFVAHEDIQPSKEWVVEISRALHTCHAMVALLSPGFVNSMWCDQEVGFAMGRQVVVVPLKYESDPHGFMASIQAIPVATKIVADVVPSIVATFLTHSVTERPMGDAIVSALVNTTDDAVIEKMVPLLGHVRSVSASTADLLHNAVQTKRLFQGNKLLNDAVEALLDRLPYRPKKRQAVYEPIKEDDIPF